MNERFRRVTGYDQTNSMTLKFGDTLLGHQYEEDHSKEGIRVHVWMIRGEGDDKRNKDLDRIWDHLKATRDVIRLTWDYLDMELDCTRWVMADLGMMSTDVGYREVRWKSGEKARVSEEDVAMIHRTYPAATPIIKHRMQERLNQGPNGLKAVLKSCSGAVRAAKRMKKLRAKYGQQRLAG